MRSIGLPGWDLVDRRVDLHFSERTTDANPRPCGRRGLPGAFTWAFAFGSEPVRLIMARFRSSPPRACFGRLPDSYPADVYSGSRVSRAGRDVRKGRQRRSPGGAQRSDQAIVSSDILAQDCKPCAASPTPRTRNLAARAVSGRRWGIRTSGLAVVAVAVAGVLAGWLFGWQGPDWAAQTYRADLFRTHGWLLWDNGWYGGHYILSYSVLFPPLSATIGLYGAAGLSAATSAWAFDRLLRDAYGQLSPVPSVLFAAATMIPVLFGQLPFLAGEAVGLVVLVLAQGRHRRLALVIAPCCALLSPVAGALLVVVLIARAIASPPDHRVQAALLTGVAAAPMVLVERTFPVSGTSPFWGGDLALVLGLCVFGLLIIPKANRVLRTGLALYGGVAVALFIVPNPLGGNYIRLTTAVAPSLLIVGSWVAQRKALAVLAIPLALWQWSPAFALMHPMAQDPSASAAYFQPLLTELSRQLPSGRVEIPLTANHWEAAFVAPHVLLARGWERQSDVAHNGLFYGNQPLNVASYERWLRDNGVTLVALPDVALDYAAKEEARLLAHPPSYLQPAWRDAHWRVWRVRGSPGLVSGPARLVSLSPDSFTVAATAHGPITVRLRYTTFWSVRIGRACLSPTQDGWTALTNVAPGQIEVRTTFADHDNRCPTTAGR
jgi:hypothetical protein